MKLLISIFLLALLSSSHVKAYKVVCYYPNWAYYRQGEGRFTVNDIDPFQCTHLIYAFAILDPVTYTLKIFDPYLDEDLENYLNFTALKTKNSQLKTLLALGGWNDSITPDKKYSILVSNPQHIENFVKNVIPLLRRFNFDGLDIDWEYPENESDKQGFTDFLNALSIAFKSENLILSAAVSCNPAKIDSGYDVPAVSSLVDFINVMSYDIHGAWDPDWADHHAPLYERPWDSASEITVERGVSHWVNKGADKKKVIMGIPLYGRSFTITDPNNVSPPASARGPGAAGIYTQDPGFMGYNEICLKILGGYAVANDPAGSPYCYGENNWIGFDNIDSSRIKANYIIDHGLGGAIVWDISTDDFLGKCGSGARPLVGTIYRVLNGDLASSQATSLSTSMSSRTSVTTERISTLSTQPVGEFECKGDELLSDKNDCEKFYRCNGPGLPPEHMDCPPGTVFDSTISICNFPESVPPPCGTQTSIMDAKTI